MDVSKLHAERDPNPNRYPLPREAAILRELLQQDEAELNHIDEGVKTTNDLLECQRRELERQEQEWIATRSLVEVLTRQLDTKKTIREKHLMDMDQKRAKLHPIKKTPEEVLKMVFQVLVDEQAEEWDRTISAKGYISDAVERQCLPVVLGSVCKRWRNICRGAGGLWANLILDATTTASQKSCTRLSESVQLAGTAPLSLTVERCGTAAQLVRVIAALEATVLASDREDDEDDTGDGPETPWLDWLMIAFKGTSGQNEWDSAGWPERLTATNLVLYRIPDRTISVFETVLAQATNVSLLNTPILPRTIKFTNATSLRLTKLNTISGIPIVAILRASPRLQVVDITSPCHIEDNSQDLKTFIHHSLEHLYIATDDFRHIYCNLLDIISLPAIAQLTIYEFSPNDEPEDLATWRRFVSKVSGQVARINLDLYHLSEIRAGYHEESSIFLEGFDNVTTFSLFPDTPSIFVDSLSIHSTSTSPASRGQDNIILPKLKHLIIDECDVDGQRIIALIQSRIKWAVSKSGGGTGVEGQAALVNRLEDVEVINCPNVSAAQLAEIERLTRDSV